MSDDDCSDQGSPKRPSKRTPIDEKQLAELMLLPVWTEQQAAEVLRDQKHSGKSILGYSRQHGVPASRLYQWKKRLPAKLRSRTVQATAAEVEPPPPFVKVAGPTPPAVIQPALAASAVETGCITVRLPSGVQVLIPQGASEALITTVLWTLRTASC